MLKNTSCEKRWLDTEQSIAKSAYQCEESESTNSGVGLCLRDTDRLLKSV